MKRLLVGISIILVIPGLGQNLIPNPNQQPFHIILNLSTFLSSNKYSTHVTITYFTCRLFRANVNSDLVIKM